MFSNERLKNIYLLVYFLNVYRNSIKMVYVLRFHIQQIELEKGKKGNCV